jgi:hypothetical protein
VRQRSWRHRPALRSVVDDPYQRIHDADLLDSALATARVWVAQIKRDTINQLRTGDIGYGRIGMRLGLTRGRIQQIASAASKLGPVVYAVRDESGRWDGSARLLRSGYTDTPFAHLFREGDEQHPSAGQRLVARYGPIPDSVPITAHSLRVAVEHGREMPLRMTDELLGALFAHSIAA